MYKPAARQKKARRADRRVVGVAVGSAGGGDARGVQPQDGRDDAVAVGDLGAPDDQPLAGEAARQGRACRLPPF